MPSSFTYNDLVLKKIRKATNGQKNTKLILMYRGEQCALTWPVWYCSVASNIDSDITTLLSNSASKAIVFS